MRGAGELGAKPFFTLEVWRWKLWTGSFAFPNVNYSHDHYPRGSEFLVNVSRDSKLSLLPPTPSPGFAGERGEAKSTMRSPTTQLLASLVLVILAAQARAQPE